MIKICINRLKYQDYLPEFANHQRLSARNKRILYNFGMALS